VVQTLAGHDDRIKDLIVHDGKIICSLSNDTIKIWDFRPSLSLYSRKILEENLYILEKMPWAQYLQQPIKKLFEKLHPDYQQRLWQHCLNLKGSFPSCEAAIFRAQTEVCIEALLNAIDDEDNDRISKLLKYLIWINPKNAEIYRLLWEICGKPNFDKWEEYAFHNQQRCSATLFQMQEAVLAFKQWLKDRWGEDLSFLVDLEIITEEEYSEKLECAPNHLPKIGFCSTEDLQALYLQALPKVEFPDFQYLQIAAEEVTKDRVLLQNRAFDKKKTVVALLDQLFAAAQKNSDETETYTVRRNNNGDVNNVPNPWVTFQEKIKKIKDGISEQGLKKEEFLEKFSSKSYATLVNEINALIDEFHTSCKREMQILVLHAYINQWGILNKWNKLHDQPIYSLSALLQKKETASLDIFNMGE